jgi:hypothetical protein
MVLDKASADKTQSDIESMAKGVEEGWKRTAEKIAEFLGAAFILEKIKEFGTEAIKLAAESEAAWFQLKGTIDATGESFDALSGDIEKTAKAFEDATIHDRDEFATSLTRMTALTGDARASLNNMGLVANVAAQFFRGELEPAANLVAKAMDGNVTQLQRMGIHARDAQEALDILAQRSMGAAEREAQTFSGQLKVLHRDWDDVLKDFGKAVIGTNDTGNALKLLQNMLENAIAWIDKNKDSIQDWVVRGINFAIDAIDTLIRAVQLIYYTFKSVLEVTIAGATYAIAKLAQGYYAAAEAFTILAVQLGTKNWDDVLQIQKMKDSAAAVAEWAKQVMAAGGEDVMKAWKALTQPVIDSSILKAPDKPPGKLPVNPPEVGKFGNPELEKALQAYEDAGKRIDAMNKILGDKFDSVGEDISRTQKLLDFLTEHGIDPATTKFGDLGFKLNDLIRYIQPTKKAAEDLADALGKETVDEATKTMTTVEKLTAIQQAYGKAIDEMTKDHIPEGNAQLQQYKKTFMELTEAIREAKTIEATTKVLQQFGDALRADLFMASLQGASALDKLKIEQQDLAKTILTMAARHLPEEARALEQLKTRYKDVTVAIQEQTVAMQAQAAAADFLADALGAALEGGLGKAAAAKAKQNAIEAAEMLVRAGVFFLFGDFPQATAAAGLAVQFGAVAAAWGLLAAASGGGGDTSAPSIPTSTPVGGAASTGTDLGSARSQSSSAAAGSQQVPADVSIYLVGPGFHATNPEVQRVVWGATQEATERFGTGTRIRIRQTSTS